MDDFLDYLNQQLQDPDFREECEALAPEYDEIRTIIRFWDPDFTKTTPSEALALTILQWKWSPVISSPTAKLTGTKHNGGGIPLLYSVA